MENSKPLKKRESGVWHYIGDIRVRGPHGKITECRPGLFGNVTDIYGVAYGIYGNVSGLCGDVSKICGDVSGIFGDATGLKGSVTGITGDLSDIPFEARTEHPDINDWVD